MSEEQVMETSNENVEDPSLCPYCGYNTKIPPISISEEDRQEYFRRMMAGEVFTKDYKYMRGDIVITMSELPIEQTDRLITLVSNLADDPRVLTYALRAKFMASCISLRIGEKTLIEKAVEDSESLQEMNDKYIAIIGKLPPTISHVVDDALTSFNKLIDGAIQEAIITKSF